jgi:hypothetical protein
MPRPVKAKKKTSEKRVVGDGLVAISFIALNETPSPNQRKNLRRATVTSNVARTNNKSSTAAPTSQEDFKNKSPVALLPSPEDGTRKCPPEESLQVDKQKQKVTTLWSRGKSKKWLSSTSLKARIPAHLPVRMAFSFAVSAMTSAFLHCPRNARSADKLKDMFLLTKLVNML